MKREYEEFRKSSEEYERELELQSDQLENKVKSTQVARQRSENELDTVRSRFTEYQTSARQQITQLQDELDRARLELSERAERVRRLEQTNDDLERANRALQANCDSLEQQLEASLEQNVFLQSELDERESVCLLIQHLRDELRDAQRENQILESRLSSRVHDEDGTDGAEAANESDTRRDGGNDTVALSWSERRALEAEDAPRVAVLGGFRSDMTPQSLPSACASAQASASAVAAGTLSPAVRIEALALVNQIVHQVGALESCVRKQLDTPSGTPTPTGVTVSSANPHKRLCLNLASVTSPLPSNVGWRSPSASGLSRFDFINVYGTLRRERGNKPSPATPHSVTAASLINQLATPHRIVVNDSSVPR